MTDSLLTRLAQAKMGSRELDLDIYREIRPDRFVPTSDTELPEGFGQDALSMEMHEAPHYTTSIDAALALKPKGFSWHMAVGSHIPGASAYICPEGGDSLGVADPRTRSGRHLNEPAIALCICFLRAREEEGRR